MKTTARGLVFVLILVLAAPTLLASGPLGIYAIVSKAAVDGGTGSGGKTLTPKRGYLYLMLPENASLRKAALKEWADFKAIAGNAIIQGVSRSGIPFREESTVPFEPDLYPLNMGLTKLSSNGDLASVVRQLQEALKR